MLGKVATNVSGRIQREEPNEGSARLGRGPKLENAKLGRTPQNVYCKSCGDKVR